MKAISFTKMVASGNDFVVVDNRRKVVKNPLRFTKDVCTLHTGIGADGVLLLEKSRKADFKMRIINSDGSEAEACGNGFRCIALYAQKKLGYPANFEFESLSGIIQANIRGGKLRVRLAKPKQFQENKKIKVLGKTLHYHFINTGVPHVVIFVEGLPKMEIEELGRAIRYHANFKPKGTNVNFVEIKGKHDVEVRTYERGVEAETQACGTGSTASAVISSLTGYTESPVRVKTRGSEILTIDFEKRGKTIDSAFLIGSANIVYEGMYSPNGK